MKWAIKKKKKSNEVVSKCINNLEKDDNEDYRNSKDYKNINENKPHIPAPKRMGCGIKSTRQP